MLWTVAVVLLSLWEVGLASSYTLGGFIHILRSLSRSERMVLSKHIHVFP